jgi:hypothetical protein
MFIIHQSLRSHVYLYGASYWSLQTVTYQLKKVKGFGNYAATRIALETALEDFSCETKEDDGDSRPPENQNGAEHGLARIHSTTNDSGYLELISLVPLQYGLDCAVLSVGFVCTEY